MGKINELRDNITARTSVKLPIGLIASIVVGIAAAWWAQFESHKHYDNERFTELRNYINKKASDRYTSSEARQLTESLKQRFRDEERANNSEHRSLQRQLDQHEKEINRLSK
jgi:hypothetical protein